MKRQGQEHGQKRKKDEGQGQDEGTNHDASSVTRPAIWAETVLLAGKARHVVTAHMLLVSVVLLACSLKFP